VATSVSVWRGALALKERITSSPRAKDCTYESPGRTSAGSWCTGAFGIEFIIRTVVRKENKFGDPGSLARTTRPSLRIPIPKDHA